MAEPQKNKEQTASQAQQVCPPWLCFTFDNWFRRLLQNPNKILKPYIKPGMKVLDVGPGMGYFTVPMAKLVGTEGEVIAADLQQQMLDGVDSRAFRAGVQERVKLHLVKAESLNIPEPIDFCLAFWMVHEVPDRAHLLNEISESLKKDGLFLMVEPRIHVSKANFSAAVRMAENAGLSLISRPKIFLSYSALLKK